MGTVRTGWMAQSGHANRGRWPPEVALSGADPREIRDLLGSGPLGPGMRADRVLTWRLTRNSQPNSIREKKGGGRVIRGGCLPHYNILVGAIPRRPAPPNATFGSQMARFARPYCSTEPVRTVPFFNLYDDIQITQLAAASRGRGVPRPSDVPAAPETRCGGFAQPTISSSAPAPPRGAT